MSAGPLVLAAILLAGAGAAGCFGRDAPADAGLACADATPPAPDAAWRNETPRVRMETTKGVVTLRLEAERAPRTVENVLDLVASGVYDGTAFHRVVPGFVVQAGDPNTKDDDPTNDGLGGPGYQLRDELNPTLRHDAAGVVSMASRGPDTAGSQFFVTLEPEPQLDDRHSVFGRVESGMEAIRAIAATPVDADKRPRADLRIARAESIEPARFDALHAVAVAPLVANKTTEPGHPATFAVTLRNLGNVRDAIALRAETPEGWTCRVDRVPVVAAGTGRIVFLTLTPPEGAASADVRLVATSAWGERADATVRVDVGALGKAAREGDLVTADYVGALPDGRVFDTTLPEVASSQAVPKFETDGGWQPRAAYAPFRFTVGAGVIPGFTRLADGARQGETVTALLPVKDAYVEGNMYTDPLTGRDLVFELRIRQVG